MRPIVTENAPLEITTNTEEETIRLGAALSAAVSAPAVICLDGPIGAGKTQIAKGVAEGLGAARREHVTSPSYDLVHEHGEAPTLAHIDLYRLNPPSPEDAEWLLDYLEAPDAITVIEWSRHAEALIPAHSVRIEIRLGEDPAERIVVIAAPPAIQKTLQNSLRKGLQKWN